jgi:hypothetical protein
MKKILLLSLAAMVVAGSQGAMASAPPRTDPRATPNFPLEEGAGVTTRPDGAFVRPGFRALATEESVTKAGAADTISCNDPSDYAPVTWNFFDRWGSYTIARPAVVTDQVRYCVAVREVGAETVNVKYDVIGE